MPHRRLLFFIAAFSLLVFSPVHAEEAAKENKDKPTPAADDQPKSLKLKLPEKLRGDGYRLLIGKDEFELNRDDIELTPSLDSAAIELYDGGGRVVDYRRDYVDAELFESLRDRKFHAQIQLGTVHPSATAPWRDIFLSGDRFQIGGEFGRYFFSGVAANLMVMIQNQSREYDEGFTASYTAILVGTNLVYRWAIFRNAKNYFRKITLTPKLGIFYAQHYASIRDSEVSVDEHSSNPGFSGGFGLEFPVYNNFNFLWSYALMMQKVELPKLGFKNTQPDHSLLLGGAYAF